MATRKTRKTKADVPVSASAGKSASPGRVVVTRGMVTICHMQVCAVADATDEEILTVCNRENPSGTTSGWSQVIRTAPEDSELWGPGEALAPKPCADDPTRLHILVVC